jgi:hypothetical protein
MKTLNATETIKKVSLLLDRKERFAFVTYTRSAIFSMTGELSGDKKPPKNFLKLISMSLDNNSSGFIKAAQRDLIKSSVDKIAQNGNSTVSNEVFYDPSFLEYYINTNYDIFKTFTSWYLKTTKVIIVSFQNKSSISKYFSPDSIYIQVPYNDFYSRIDSITQEIIEKSSETSLCVLDCPMLSTALAQNLWEKSDMSILDLGRTLTVARSLNRNK